MPQVIKSNQDILSFGKYNGLTISEAHIDWLMWAIKVQAIIIESKDLELELLKRRDSFNRSREWILKTCAHFGDEPYWGDDY